MTREKQIFEESKIYSEYEYNQTDFENGFINGAKWADKNPRPQYIAEYLYKEKGYPISLNGEIPTFEETMKDVQTYNDYKAKQWLEKACSWLREQTELIGISFQEDFIERFKIAMKTDHENSSELANKYDINVWQDVREEPKNNSDIIIVDTERELWHIEYVAEDFGDGELHGWEYCISHFNLKMWAYFDDLVPKGGLK